MTEYTNPNILDILKCLSIVVDVASIGIILSFAMIIKLLLSLRAEQRNISTAPSDLSNHPLFKVIKACASAYAVAKIISGSLKLAFTSESPVAFDICVVTLYSMILIMIQLAPRSIKRELERQKQANTASLPLRSVSNDPEVNPPTTREEKL
ncbi:hypothetical protein BDQ12DRAFT_714017 [Crucibulum laeve]|uniref:Uncharacterized protein n=1 Tax=Crucibulum laeve TaxID=68775 RepID=A0A5C3LUQ2_9AGAR|nr:hypothetical protein BDQ12DRAFT_714017 [Crucibulum laeve]